MNNLTIRLETEKDYRAVEELIREAFWNVYKPGADEHYFVHTMRSHPDFIPELAFVLEKDGEIIGNIMYTKSWLEDEEGNILPPFSFLPVKIGFQYPPKEIIMETESGVETTLYDVRHRDEDAIGVLDDFDIVYVDLSLSHGKRDENGRWTAYVHQLYAKVEENRWEAKHPRRRDDDYEED